MRGRPNKTSTWWFINLPGRAATLSVLGMLSRRRRVCSFSFPSLPSACSRPSSRPQLLLSSSYPPQQVTASARPRILPSCSCAPLSLELSSARWPAHRSTASYFHSPSQGVCVLIVGDDFNPRKDKLTLWPPSPLSPAPRCSVTKHLSHIYSYLGIAIFSGSLTVQEVTSAGCFDIYARRAVLLRL